MNLNDLAREVSVLEKGKKELSIAEIKEVIKCICIIMAKNPLLIAKMIVNGTKNGK